MGQINQILNMIHNKPGQVFWIMEVLTLKGKKLKSDCSNTNVKILITKHDTTWSFSYIILAATLK